MSERELFWDLGTTAHLNDCAVGQEGIMLPKDLLDEQGEQTGPGVGVKQCENVRAPKSHSTGPGFAPPANPRYSLSVPSNSACAEAGA